MSNANFLFLVLLNLFSIYSLTLNAEIDGNMQNESYGSLSNEETSGSRDSQNSEEKAMLSGEDFETKFRESCDIFLNINRRVVGLMDEQFHTDPQLDEPIVRNKKEEGSLQNIHAMEAIGALFCPTWGQGMKKNWQSTHKDMQWPPNEIKQAVPSLGFHIVPYKEEIIKEPNIGEDEQKADDLDGKKIHWSWKLNFRVAEQYLFKHFNIKQRQIVYCVLALLSRFREIQQVKELNELIRHCMLRFFGGNSIDSSSEIVKFTEKLLEFLLQNLEEGKCPNYFVPACNLLDNVPGDVMKGLVYVIKSTLGHLKSLLIGLKYLPIQTYVKSQKVEDAKDPYDGFTDWLGGFGETVKKLLKISLLKSFDDIINLLIMTSFAQHYKNSIDTSIATHEDVIKMLSTMRQGLMKEHRLIAQLGNVVKRFTMFVQVSLGCY